MMKMLVWATCLSFAGTLMAAQDSREDAIELYKNDVIPVKIDQSIYLSKSERGDRFSAVVDGDRTLPKGTVFEGRVLEVRQKSDGRPGSITLEFNRLVLPNGDSIRIEATPVAWREKSMSRSRDGRWEAKGKMKREDWVIGGLAGGLIIGSMARKPFEGAFIGTLAGIILGESDKTFSDDLVMRRGDKVGALIERNVAVDDTGEEANRLRVTYEGRDLLFSRDQMPYESEGTVMVPLEAAAKALDVSVDLQEDRDFILISGKENSVRLNRNESDYRLNGKRRELPRNIETRNGVLYVPLEVFEHLVDGTLRADGTKIEQKE